MGDVAREPEQFASGREHTRDLRDAVILHEAPLPMASFRPGIGIEQIEPADALRRAARPAHRSHRHDAGECCEARAPRCSPAPWPSVDERLDADEAGFRMGFRLARSDARRRRTRFRHATSSPPALDIRFRPPPNSLRRSLAPAATDRARAWAAALSIRLACRVPQRMAFAAAEEGSGGFGRFVHGQAERRMSVRRVERLILGTRPECKCPDRGSGHRIVKVQVVFETVRL